MLIFSFILQFLFINILPGGLLKFTNHSLILLSLIGFISFYFLLSRNINYSDFNMSKLFATLLLTVTADTRSQWIHIQQWVEGCACYFGVITSCIVLLQLQRMWAGRCERKYLSHVRLTICQVISGGPLKSKQAYDWHDLKAQDLAPCPEFMVQLLGQDSFPSWVSVSTSVKWELK